MFRKYPSLFLLIFVVAGIFIADCWHPSSWLLFTICVFFALAGFIALCRSRLILACFMLGFSLGAVAAFHFSVKVYNLGPDHFSKIVNAGEKYLIYGRVVDWPDLKPERTEIKISLDSLVTNQVQKVTGSILLKISDTTTALQRGDRVEFSARIYPVREQVSSERFNYYRYLNLKGVFGVVYLTTANEVRLIRRGRLGFFALTDRLRETIKRCFYSNLSPLSAALATGFLIGETRDIPPGIYRMFRDSGTLHLLAVSGSNVALVVLFFVWFLRPFNIGRHKRYVILLAVIVVFTVLSYGEPSVVRASLMAVLVIGAVFFQRRFDLNNIIALTAFMIIMVEPAQLFDVGFQLSFVTAWGLIFITPVLSELFKPWHARRWYLWLVFPVMISLVAQLCSTPIVACYFGRIPIIGVIANLLIVPLVSLSVLGVMVLLVADLIFPILGQFVGSLVNVLLNLIVTLLQGLGGESIPIVATGNMFKGDWTVFLVLAVYGLLWIAVMAVRTNIFRKITLLYFLVFVNILLIYNTFTDEDRDWPKLTVSSVPGGAIALVQESEFLPGTLILTDMQARSYQIDEKILDPFLEESGLERLARVLVLTLDYNAIDDLLRTALKYRARYVYINQSLKASFADVISERFKGTRINFEIIEFGSPDNDTGRYGIFPERECIRLITAEKRVFFVNELNALPVNYNKDGKDNWLVVGRKLHPTISDLQELYRSGISRIICSKIEPYISDKDTIPQNHAEKIPSDYLFDISRQGFLRLPL